MVTDSHMGFPRCWARPLTSLNIGLRKRSELKGDLIMIISMISMSTKVKVIKQQTEMETPIFMEQKPVITDVVKPVEKSENINQLFLQ